MSSKLETSVVYFHMWTLLHWEKEKEGLLLPRKFWQTHQPCSQAVWEKRSISLLSHSLGTRLVNSSAHCKPRMHDYVIFIPSNALLKSCLRVNVYAQCQYTAVGSGQAGRVLPWSLFRRLNGLVYVSSVKSLLSCRIQLMCPGLVVLIVLVTRLANLMFVWVWASYQYTDL